LFLDEVGDMTLALQAKLLRFLQEGVITQVGGRIEKRVDVRVIAATHRDLEAMVEDKSFREDLYYRLAVVPVRTPALRERRDDIPVLAEHFLRKKAAKLGKPVPKLAPETLTMLAAHNFPGNVRELENALEYALNMIGNRDVILPEDLPDRVQGLDNSAVRSASLPSVTAIQDAGNIPKDLPLDAAVMALEVEWIHRAMQATGGNISHAAKALGLSRQGLHNKLAKHGIKGE
jgi:two-component system NtrC family response regulator